MLLLRADRMRSLRHIRFQTGSRRVRQAGLRGDSRSASPAAAVAAGQAAAAAQQQPSVHSAAACPAGARSAAPPGCVQVVPRGVPSPLTHGQSSAVTSRGARALSPQVQQVPLRAASPSVKPQQQQPTKQVSIIIIIMCGTIFKNIFV